MQLVSFQESRIVYITQMHRPAGQVYLPEAIAALAARYSFVKRPSVENPGVDYQSFGVGKFEDVQIQEVRVYGDGIIVSSQCNTDILERFLKDLLSFMAGEFGIVNISTVSPETSYESNLVVRSSVDIMPLVGPSVESANLLTKMLAGKRYLPATYQPYGFALEPDSDGYEGKRKPGRFALERRIGAPFTENVFFSIAPLRTNDHLRLLESFEGFAARSS